jgi:hypothetical protein
MATPTERTLTLKEDAGVFQTDTFIKDPDGVVDFKIDWTNTLNGDTISTSTWTVPSGITEDSESETTTAATIFVSGGTASTAYVLTNQIVTAGGVTQDRSITVYVEESSTDAATDATLPPDTIDTSTNVGKVRLNIGDVSTDPTKRLFSDTEISSFLSQNSSDVNLASAAALEALASQALLVADMRKIGEHTIDRRKQSELYLKAAERFRAKADEFPAVGRVEIAYTEMQAAEIIENEWIRNT